MPILKGSASRPGADLAARCVVLIALLFLVGVMNMVGVAGIAVLVSPGKGSHGPVDPAHFRRVDGGGRNEAPVSRVPRPQPW
ncbi:hypothetical protein FJ934_19265 [Mesorhizobium sp. B2-4-12]|uniref:hypothetical protein n=1 Tax=unclassified Mesorhizobium TaxID=325217 RepID=UPI0011266809|nr:MULTISPECIES: hypothetical protein [unclassified Mesorhizobium]TPK87382.1 hypothetical protein FJ548_14400 [Mesorhizobium sp. B2-4-17]TPK93142.1 hypothetical protein FJ934_19265 [Mesorhizobium sp. B2-4-12]TPL02919.1 hypothetical protein FJ938_18860 [Mesorhizobium sp. B2-4-14]